MNSEPERNGCVFDEEIHCGQILLEQREAKGFATRPAICDQAKELEREDKVRFKAFSVSSLWGWENDSTGLRIGRASNKTLRTLSYLLGWTEAEFAERIGFGIGPVPRLDDDSQSHIFSFVERYGVKFKASVRLPVYRSVAAGVEGFDNAEEPDHFEIFDLSEVPGGIDPKTLYMVWANGNSMYEEGMARPIPNGSRLMVEHRAPPENNKIVVAYIPERDIGVVKQYRDDQSSEEAVLRSFREGGPCFRASDYPSMYVSGVVRRVVFDV